MNKTDSIHWRGALSRRTALALLAVLTAACRAQEKPAPLAACIEPAVIRTEAARLMPGSKLTVIVPARPDEIGLLRLSKEEFAATGLTWEKFLTEAAATAAAHLKTLKPDIKRDKKGTAQYAVLKSDSHLTASTVLCPEFFALVRETFGDKLVVLIPDRFTVYVFPRGFAGFQTMGPDILTTFQKSTWPASQEAFELTPDGLKCLGAFVLEEEAPEAPANKPS